MAANRKYKINEQIARDSDSYDRDIIEKYLEYLHATDNAIEIGNVVVDVEEVVRRKFVCDTRLCIKTARNNFLKRRSCCTEYSVRVSEDEAHRIAKMLPEIAEHYPDTAAAIESAGGFCEFDSWFDRVLRKRPEGICIFLADQGNDVFHCAIHGTALRTGKKTLKSKPSACSLFPLCYLEHDGGLILTAYSLQNARVIEGENEPIAYDCCEPNPLATRPLYVEMKNTLIDLLGKDFYVALEREIGKRGLDGSSA